MATPPTPGSVTGNGAPRRSPLRVAMLVPTLAPAGGLCRWSRETVRALEMVTTPDELSIDVLCRSSVDTARQTVEQYGLRCQIHDISVGAATAGEAARSIRHTTEVINRIRPDVIYTPLDWLWLLSDRRRVRPRIIAVAHGEPSRETVRTWNRRLAQRLSRRGALTLVANSESLRPVLDQTVGVAAGTSISLPIGTDPIRVGPDGSGNSEWSDNADNASGPDTAVDLRSELHIHPDELIVLTLCRLVPGKRVDLVLDVVDRARREDLAIRFVICGEGPELGPLSAEAERRNQQGWVHFLGHIGNPSPLLMQADALLHTSDSEGLPFSLIESLQAGTPVVATDVGGVADLLTDPDDGLTAPKGDPDAILVELCEVLQREPRSQERAKRAEEKFGWSASGDAHWDVLRTATEGL